VKNAKKRQLTDSHVLAAVKALAGRCRN